LIAGDINIDLKKYQYHADTKSFLDILIVNNFIQVVVMPTRNTDRRATLPNEIVIVLLQVGICGVTSQIIFLILFSLKRIQKEGLKPTTFHLSDFIFLKI